MPCASSCTSARRTGLSWAQILSDRDGSWDTDPARRTPRAQFPVRARRRVTRPPRCQHRSMNPPSSLTYCCALCTPEHCTFPLKTPPVLSSLAHCRPRRPETLPLNRTASLFVRLPSWPCLCGPLLVCPTKQAPAATMPSPRHPTPVARPRPAPPCPQQHAAPLPGGTCKPSNRLLPPEGLAHVAGGGHDPPCVGWSADGAGKVHARELPWSWLGVEEGTAGAGEAAAIAEAGMGQWLLSGGVSSCSACLGAQPKLGRLAERMSGGQEARDVGNGGR